MGHTRRLQRRLGFPLEVVEAGVPLLAFQRIDGHALVVGLGVEVVLREVHRTTLNPATADQSDVETPLPSLNHLQGLKVSHGL